MTRIAERYVLLDQLGSGAMGIVWRARDEVLHREVAIKQLLLPDLRPGQVDAACQRAMREGRIAARLHHPNAIGVHDVVIEDGKPCLVMEYLPSRSLSAVLAERGTLPPAEAAKIGVQVAAALAAAHAAGIVHRDIKPGNVLIGHDGSVKITDFGISRAAGDVAVTKTGMLSGTLAYLAPELARGAEPNAAADMFSLGATLYAMTEGQPPFGRSANEFGLLYKISTGAIAPPERSGPLTPLLTALLSMDPSARPTAAQTVEELASGTPHATVEVPRPPVGPTRKRRWVAVAAAAVAVVAAVTVLTTYVFDRDRTSGSANGTSTPPASSSQLPTAFTTGQVDEFVKQHFAKLPKDTADARKDWVPEFRPAEKDDDRYWGAYEGVWIYGEPVISSSVLDSDRYAVEVDLTLRKKGAKEKDVTIRRHRLDLQVKDGRLLIAHTHEVGS